MITQKHPEISIVLRRSRSGTQVTCVSRRSDDPALSAEAERLRERIRRLLSTEEQLELTHD